MSIKSLFEKIPASYDSANSSSAEVESHDYVIAKSRKQTEFVPRLDFSTASNFAVYGSAEEYYKSAIERIYNFYPYDGSKKEKINFSLSSSYIDDWLYNNKYPKTVGHINFSYGGWGTGTITEGYGIPTNREYIYSRGGLHTASDGMAGIPLHKTFDKSVKYKESINRTTNYRMNTPDGITVEFWLKKDEFDISKTKKEVILDLWNGELSSSSDYGRLTVALTASGPAEQGQDVFLVTLQSGTVGFFEQTIGNSSITTGSFSDWHHYALSFSSASTGVASKIYVDGVLNETKSLGSFGVDEVGGLINAYLGALQTSPSSSNGALTQDQLKYAGKLSASIDEFRYWKTLRSSKQIQDNWNRVLGSGTNTDESNVNLGVYYKFNEGITGTASVDSVVLDYSGRIANGNWNGYSAGARSTDSGIDLHTDDFVEEKDPIIYSFHPKVISLLDEMAVSGSLHDQENGNMLINKLPSWILDDDQENNNHLKYLTQIISSYLDKLNAQISQLKTNKFSEYAEGNIKPLTFADRLLQERGLVSSDILINSEILEFFEKRNKDGLIYENEIFDIKNMIYQNIYNNLNYILKSKGTEDSFRNLIRCFGIDDEILKINRYTDKGTHYFTDKVKHTSVYKKFINHNKDGAFDASVFQTSSAQNSLTFISGSSSDKKEKNYAFTFEINLLAPEKIPSSENEYISFPYLSSSIGGFHQAKYDENDYAWNSSDVANLQMYVVRDKVDSPGGYFLIKNYNNSVFLTSSYFKEIYNNHNWTLAARVKPSNYPYSGIKSSPEEPTYKLEFYGVHHRGDVLIDSFLVTSSLSYAVGSSYLSERKRIYVGAHRTNYTSSLLEYSDLSIGTCRFYLDYLDNEVIQLHNKDIKNYGSNKTFEGSSLINTDTENNKLSSAELLLLNWDFETVTGSDSSGNFVVEDVSSGSSDARYGYLDNILNTEHRGKGFGFSASSQNFVRNNFMYAAKKELPEISFTADDIVIKEDLEGNFIEDLDVSDNFYAFEKGMYQVISEEMLNYMSSVTEMNNLIGKVVDKYRFNYKNLDYMRRIFFEKVEEDPDLDKFTEYFKWIDKSIYVFLEQLIPASARYSSKISDVVESHIFERNKVRNLIPNKFVEATPSDFVNSIRELKYNWKFGHAPGILIPEVIGQINFDVNQVSSINHGSTLQVTGGTSATTFLVEINDPNVAVAYPNADLILRTGSNGLALKASGSSVAVASGVNYGVSGDTLENKSFTISWWYYSGDNFNQSGIFLRSSSPSLVHQIDFDGDIEISLYNAAGTNDTARFNDSNTQSDSGEWNHYVAFFDVDDLSTGGPRLWKNGTELTATGYTAIGGTTPTVNGLTIQLDDEVGFQDMVFWSGSLSQADVNELYNSGSWYNPSLHTQKTKIIDWYRFGYEPYWSGLGYAEGDDLSEQNPSDSKFISSSFGTGNNDLRIITAYDEDFQFVAGINPYGAAKSNSVFWGELSSSLSSSFEDFTIPFPFSGGGPATFTMLSKSVGNNTLAASETGNDFDNITVTQGLFKGVRINDNDNCLWQKERKERLDIADRETIRQVIVNDNNQKANTLANESGTTYQASTYALRRLTRTYKESVSMQKLIHGGINYERQKRRRISKNVIEPHSKLNSVGTPINVITVGAGPGQGIQLKTECNDIVNPNEKKKFDVQTFLGKFASGGQGGSFSPLTDSELYTFGIKGALALPFNIFSASVNSGYNKAFDEGWKPGTIITNLHSDTVAENNDIPIQSPFTERWVGGHQSRHQDVNRHDTTLIDGESLSSPPNNLHNIYTRPESHRLLLLDGGSEDGAFGLVDAQYGVTDITGHPNDGKYPDVAKKKAVYFRDEVAKRPVNIKNIQTTTSSYSHGNYEHQYQVLCVASGKQHNNPLFRSIADTHQYLPSAIENILPQTTNYNTLIGVSNHSSGNVFGVGESNILNNTLEVFSPEDAGRITFTLDVVTDIDHAATLQVTGGAVKHLTEINNPSTAGISYIDADLILRTGSFGFAFRAPLNPTYTNSNRANNNSYSGVSSNDFSVSFWLYNGYIQSSNNTKILWQDGANESHRISFDTNKIKVRYKVVGTGEDTAEFTSDISGDANTWQHYVVHFAVSDLSSGTPRVWKNGVELSGTGYSPIGGSSVTLDRLLVHLDDQMGYQDIVVWKKLLTQEDIDIIYANGVWNNPSFHPSASVINDWYKYGYEDYWTEATQSAASASLATLGGFGHGPPFTISSSFGTGGNDLAIDSNYDQDFFFVVGNNPYNKLSPIRKSNATFFAELSSSLSSSFTKTGTFSSPDLLVSHDSSGPVNFTLQSTTVGSAYVLAASETGNDFDDIVVTPGSSETLETGYINTTSKATGSTQKSVITTRFSSPGAIETMTYGFLDAYNHELSVYNALPYRNLHIRGSGSGEAGTIRVDDHLGNREGLLTHLSRHSGKFGADSAYGSVTSASYVTKPSIHKIQRNTARKPASNSSLANPTFNLDHDNGFVLSSIPRSEFQYNWITSSLGYNYSITSGKQRMYGYAPKDGIMSSSYVVDGDSGYVPAITFPTASELFGE